MLPLLVLARFARGWVDLETEIRYSSQQQPVELGTQEPFVCLIADIRVAGGRDRDRHLRVT